MADLWSDWKKHYEERGIQSEGICKDGILGEKFETVKIIKLLFIMKEANDYAKGDLKELFQNGPKYGLGYNIARWSAGILKNFPEYEEINKKDILTESIHSVAAINLKKTTGGGKADMCIISAYAHQDRELLLRQINEIKPKIIVACGRETFAILIWFLNLNVKVEQPLAEPIFSEKVNSIVIPFRHPSFVPKPESEYNKLKEIWEREEVKKLLREISPNSDMMSK